MVFFYLNTIHVLNMVLLILKNYTLKLYFKKNENNQQSNYQNISLNNFMQSLNKKSDNKIFVIVGIVIFAIIIHMNIILIK